MASMRELRLQRSQRKLQPSAYGLSVNTAARQHLDAQFEHLRAYLREERNKLEQTLAGDRMARAPCRARSRRVRYEEQYSVRPRHPLRSALLAATWLSLGTVSPEFLGPRGTPGVKISGFNSLRTVARCAASTCGGSSASRSRQWMCVCVRTGVGASRKPSIANRGHKGL